MSDDDVNAPRFYPAIGLLRILNKFVAGIIFISGLIFTAWLHAQWRDDGRNLIYVLLAGVATPVAAYFPILSNEIITVAMRAANDLQRLSKRAESSAGNSEAT